MASTDQSSYYGSDIVSQLSYKHVDFGSSDRDDKYGHLLPPKTSGTVGNSDEDLPRVEVSGTDIVAYYQRTLIPSLVRLSSHLLKPPNLSKESEALELCEENRFCVKNQQNLLKRIEKENVSKRQEAAAKLAKLRLFQKSSQFITKKKSENGGSATIEKEAEKSAVVSQEKEDLRPSADRVTKENPGVVPNKGNSYGSTVDELKLTEHSAGQNGVNSSHKSLDFAAKTSNSSHSTGNGLPMPAQHFYANYEVGVPNSNHNSTGSNDTQNLAITRGSETTAAVVLSTSPSQAPDLASGVANNDSRSISTPMSLCFTGGLKGGVTSSERPASVAHFINFSDFESDSTPFDAVAIQSVNDKEELEQIFRVDAATAGQQPGAVTNFTGGGNLGFGGLNHQSAVSMYPPSHTVSSTGSNPMVAQNRSDNYFIRNSGQESAKPNANFVQNAAAYANLGGASTVHHGYDLARDSTAINEMLPEGCSRPPFHLHSNGLAGIDTSFPHVNQHQQLPAVTSNSEGGALIMPHMTNYNSFSAYLPFPARSYTLQPGIANNVYDANTKPTAPTTTTGHLNATQMVNGSANNQTYGHAQMTTVYRMPPSTQSKVHQNSMVSSGPRSLSPRTESNLTSNPVDKFSNRQSLMTNSSLSSTLKDFNSGANCFEQKGLPVGSAGHCNQPKSMPQSVPAATTAPEVAMHHQSINGLLGGMKSAKSVGDLSSLMPGADDFSKFSSCSSNSHSRTADFNIYYPMSSHLPIKR